MKLPNEVLPSILDQVALLTDKSRTLYRLALESCVMNRMVDPLLYNMKLDLTNGSTLAKFKPCYHELKRHCHSIDKSTFFRQIALPYIKLVEMNSLQFEWLDLRSFTSMVVLFVGVDASSTRISSWNIPFNIETLNMYVSLSFKSLLGWSVSPTCVRFAFVGRPLTEFNPIVKDISETQSFYTIATNGCLSAGRALP